MVPFANPGTSRAFDGNEADAMTGFACFGFWATAAIYAAIGVIGIPFGRSAEHRLFQLWRNRRWRR
ncbi:MAG: hypothetical protein WBB34_06430 [Xanthobacteraceae bacterium]